jgi:hypothetical protein
MAGEEIQRRRELLAPYGHPYRHCLGAVWRAAPQLRRTTYLCGAMAAGMALGVLVDEPALTAVGAFVGAVALILLLRWIVEIARQAWRMTRSWSRRSELRTVREQRQQAGSEDPDLAHDQYAVTVQDDGDLVTWRFRPLRIGEAPRREEVEVAGRPCYAASPVELEPFDVHDTARAAEQLVAAQEAAAAREAQAAAEAVEDAEAARDRAELANEAPSTAAALRGSTGEHRRD